VAHAPQSPYDLLRKGKGEKENTTVLPITTLKRRGETGGGSAPGAGAPRPHYSALRGVRKKEEKKT